jgi:glyoxylase I family protein
VDPVRSRTNQLAAAPLRPDPKSETTTPSQSSQRRVDWRDMRHSSGARFHHVALRVADCERSAAFYGGLLGLAERRRLHDERGLLRAVWLDLDPGVLMLERALRGTGPQAGSGHVLAVAVDDLAPWEEALTAAGVHIDDRTPATLFLRDPDGHRVGLSVFRF